MGERLRYERYMDEQRTHFEALCKRCGECCGSQDGDPCENLVFDHMSGTYFCNNYEQRFGTHKTITGKTFTCVPINEIIIRNALRENCGYDASYF